MTPVKTSQIELPEASASVGWRPRLAHWSHLSFTASLGIMIFAIPLSEAVKNVFFSMALGFFIVWWLLGKKRWPQMGIPGWGFASYVAVALLAAWMAISPWEGFRGVWDITRFSLCYLLVLNGSLSRRTIGGLLVLAVASLFIGSVWGFVNLWWGLKGAFQIHSLGHENHTATYVLIGLGIVMSGAWHWRRSKVRHWGLTLLAGFLMLGLLLTYSRSALLTFLVILVIAGVSSRRWLPIRVVLALSGVFIIVGLVNINFQSFKRLVFTPQQEISQNVRWSYWKGSIDIVRDFPLTGVGPRNFKFASRWGYEAYSDHAHSLYFNTAAESGLLGLEALFLLLGTLIYSWYRQRPPPADPLAQTIHWATLGSWLTIVINGLMTTTLHTESAMLLAILFGLNESFQDAVAVPAGEEPRASSILQEPGGELAVGGIAPKTSEAP